MHYMYKFKKKHGSSTIKIDLHKAYDSVDWGFLRQTLVEFGFPKCIINFIMFCIAGSTLSLIWNRDRLESLSPNRGLRQGDPNVPLPFCVVHGEAIYDDI